MNYYLITDFCPCCGKPRERVHLGKSSCGWRFLFQKSKYVIGWASFQKFINTGNIVDEDGRQYSPSDLIYLIEEKQFEKRHTGNEYEYIDGREFLADDFD